MRLGRKPVAIVDKWEIEFWESDINTFGWGVIEFNRLLFNGRPVNDFVVYVPGEEWRARRVAFILKSLSTKRLSLIDEVRLGCLLGYTKRCISAFVERVKIMDSEGEAELYDALYLICMSEEEYLEESKIPPWVKL